ncbi:NADP-dependent oxidoreductase [Lentzea flaviverrucosa]|uniref:NADPH:quinone reductase n=1 Tax=Lentzea flaviverrucosa TaxID=200379 RepID=A0A1H9KD29_9PSEU|nr:NADP-dependent oxidoreductase [Lentzea flaviverrucosa]RDI17826.1 NADPH:quinone reductase-like Zn-dependent oxidoreductase [Lentzea flaviverrucosa]SEQ96805.1 NADPH:quinone reductase [Lentzea flaviverrucosa]
MKAITYTTFGGPEVLSLNEVEEPHAGPGQVRLKVVAAAVNPLDHKIRNGWMPPQMTPPFPATPGLEAAGIVDEVGEGVTGVAVGDSVLGWTVTGAYAEYALASDFALKPADLDWDTAAALPVAVETSVRVLDELEVGEGDTLLVHGASGVVGAVGVQLAVARGATVIGTASPANHDYLRSLGAIPVAYGEGLADRVRAAAPRGVDAVYDAAGQGDLPLSVELRGGTDRIITIADPQAAELGVTFSGGGAPFGTRLTEYAQLVVDGKLAVRVARSLPLAEAAEAQDLVATGHAPGKVVLRPVG